MISESVLLLQNGSRSEDMFQEAEKVSGPEK